MSSANVLPSAPAYGDREETQLYPSLPTNAENFRLTEISKIEKEISAEAEHYRLVLKKYKKVRKVIHYSVVCLGTVTAALSSGAVATSLAGVGIVIGVPVAAVAGGNDDIDADSCSCSSGLDGKQSCKTGYRLVFQTRSTDNYAMKQPAIGSDLSELSMCFFMKIVPDGQEHSVISYSKETANDLYISFPPQSTTVFIGNTKMSIDMVANSTWHHFCFTWENTNGVYKSYKDGKLEAQGDDFRKGYILRSGGTVVLGQDQDSIGGGFNTNDAFVGEMTEVNMWGSVLSESDIAAQYENCSIPHGSVLAWPIFKDVMHGQVQVVEP
ncbi:hypothetical protein ACROYT_G016779 [Oculina patagonica]